MVTVLMGVYNATAPMLEQALRSVLQQSFRGFEFLILDDGSTLAETRCALELSAQADPRIRLVREPHRGLTGTLNRGLDLAQGSLIARQDADDWSEPSRFERQLEYFERHPATVLLGTGALLHQQDGTPLWRVRRPETHVHITAAFRSGNPFFHGSVMFRKEAALRTGGYRVQMPCSQDYDFFWRLSEAGAAANLPDALYHYRHAAGSVSASRAAEQARAHAAAQILAEARAQGVPEDVEAALAQAGDNPAGAFRAALRQADHLLLAGDYSRAAKAYWDAARSRPASAVAWAKLLRGAMFRGVPPSRRLCFW
ncbi:MAG TPA: glycosyltransferase [Bryobacteraceae bacterium]|jgi:glycosyltransferase involved in cell wall biosynthesis